MANDKKISELPIVQTINAADKSILISNNADYQFDFATLLQFINAGLAAGANLSFGTVLPQNTSGKNGDVFINTTSGSFAQKITGVWTVVYTIATGAANDTTVLYGNSIPATTTGNNGDTFINTLSGIFYKKSGGSWNQVFSMQTGPQGPQGTSGANGTNGANGKTILNGTVNPANSLGTDGDFYINTSSYYLFGPKAAGLWGTGISLIVSGVEFEEIDNKNMPNGYAGLDSSGKVAAAQLPSYVDDVLEFATLSSLPATGETGKIYITTDNNNQYRWSGSAYTQIVGSPGSTDAVPEGTSNKYFTLARVLNAVLTGIGFGSSAIVSATDTVLQALGKLQAQISALFKIPNGGAAGQVLAKVDSTDGNLHWINAATGGGLPNGGTSGQFLAKNSTADGDAHWVDAPAGGSSTPYVFPKLPMNNAKGITSYGMSIDAGYTLADVRYTYNSLLYTRIGLAASGNNYAQSATQSGSILIKACETMGVQNNLAVTVNMGFNDLQPGQILAKTYSRVQCNLRAFLAQCFLSGFYAANRTGVGTFATSRTGVWTDFTPNIDYHVYPSKAIYDFGSTTSKPIQSTVAGSSITLGTSGKNTIVIGTYVDDGASENALGSFSITYNNKTIIYNPTDKTNNISDITGRDAGISGDAIILYNVITDVVITTLSNTRTIIDYFGWVAKPTVDSAPVFVLSSIDVTESNYISGVRDSTTISGMNTAVQEVVKEFASRGLPVTFVNINENYDPYTMTTDGQHPNAQGHETIANNIIKMWMVGVDGFAIPRVTDLSEKFVTTTASGVNLTYETADYLVNSAPLTSADFSTGQATVTGKIGQISADMDFMYFCVGINTWVRVALIQNKIDLFLSEVDDSNGAKNSDQLNAIYPTAVNFQIARGIQYNYQKISSLIWEKTAKSIA
ncbi:hypothetical protein [Mucilaginibacter celer]|uniref:Uncharacterized protein n=1 Tax=Mucilaginibacter celer TaxID=2305508 RepID=A0A494VY67_9SPHI|nr:hypothetical protein [Mucilaginibacter celer]AYL96423.1 hypothetical protein HYN43_014440 [Mucilaginibacter celer]